MLFQTIPTDPNLGDNVQGYKEVLQLSLDINNANNTYILAQSEAVTNLSKMDRNMSEIVKQMGVTTQYSQLLKQELGRAVTEVSLMGGKQEDINKLQKEFNEATNRTIVLSTENIEKLFAVSQVSGVAVKTLETSFRNAGMETTHISEEMKTVYHTANSLGVNAQTVSTMVVANLDKMNRYGFGTGIEGMAKMAAKAAAMRVDMAQTLAVADKLFSPESAIEVASTLQRLGATSSALLDPLKLMDLAQNNVPELQNQLSELSKTFTKFDKETGKFQIMPEARRQLKEVADALGIDRAEFEKMALESAKLEKKMSEIDFSRLNLKNIDEDQKMMLANLAEFNKSTGDYTVKFTDDKGVAVEKALSALEDGDLEKIKIQQQTLDPQKELVNVAKEQLGASNTLIAQNNALIETIKTQYAISKTGMDFLNTSVELQAKTNQAGMKEFSLDLSKQQNEFGVTLFQGLTDISTGKMTQENATDFLTQMALGNIETMSSLIEAQSKILAENPVGVSIATLSKNVDGLSKLLGVNLTEAVTNTVNYIKSAVSTLTVFGGVSQVLGGDKKSENTDLGGKDGKASPKTTPPASPPTTPPPTPLPVGGGETSLRKIEHKIELTVRTEINNTEVATAITKAFSNDDTLRTLRTEIAKVASDYGLTA